MFLTTVVHESYQQHLQELSALSRTHSKQDHLEKVPCTVLSTFMTMKTVQVSADGITQED